MNLASAEVTVLMRKNDKIYGDYCFAMKLYNLSEICYKAGMHYVIAVPLAATEGLHCLSFV